VTMFTIEKQHADTDNYHPLETLSLIARELAGEGLRLRMIDGEHRVCADQPLTAGRTTLTVRGSAGMQRLEVTDAQGDVVFDHTFRLTPRSGITETRGPLGRLARRVQAHLEAQGTARSLVVNDRVYTFLSSWVRDHAHKLKAGRYLISDVKSGMEFFLERQHDSGMIWDDVHANPKWPAPSWFGEALGEGFFGYDDDRRYTLRRIPVEADVEFLTTEGVWYAWKASGDDAWMRSQLPRLEKALAYNSSHPDRWSERLGLVRRSFCMDSWDFANPHFCHGDHRRINPGDPQFLFHSDNSGLYASHWRMADMYEALGETQRAAELREQGEALRRRANEKLFFDTQYGHMIPEELPEAEVYALVGDERKRMSLSTGYTLNRGMPTHEMVVAVLKEYQRRREANADNSFAEWWAMDPMYTSEQWPDGRQGKRRGQYMNGSITPLVGAELAKAAFDHGMADYGVDILERIWALSQRDAHRVSETYFRTAWQEGDMIPPTPADFTPIDLRGIAHIGLTCGATPDVPAWTGEGDNDMRSLPTGRQTFAGAEFEVIDPSDNDGRSVVALGPEGGLGESEVVVPAGDRTGASLYFLHALAGGGGGVVATYDILYADGTEHRIYIRNGQEIGPWWGITELNARKKALPNPVRPDSLARIGWRGANGQWKNVGLFAWGWDNPHPDKPISAIRLRHVAGKGVMLAGVSLSDQPVRWPQSIRSGGWPPMWTHASVYYGLMEGLAGITDEGRAFSDASIAPNWSATDETRAAACLHYPASDGYAAYTWEHDASAKRIALDVAGSFRGARVRCLLPAGATSAEVTVDGEPVQAETTELEEAHYAEFALDGIPTGPIIIHYR
jgi:hypothetical protein